MAFWPSTRCSDSQTDQTFHQFHDLDTELDLHWMPSIFHRTYTTGVTCHQGTLTLPDTWFRPFSGLAYAPIVETSFPKLAVSFLYFLSWISFGTFSILLPLCSFEGNMETCLYQKILNVARGQIQRVTWHFFVEEIVMSQDKFNNKNNNNIHWLSSLMGVLKISLIKKIYVCPQCCVHELAFSRVEHSRPYSDVAKYIFDIWYLLTMLFVCWFLWPLRLLWLLVCCRYKEVYLQIFKCVSFWLQGWTLRGVGRCTRKPG